VDNPLVASRAAANQVDNLLEAELLVAARHQRLSLGLLLQGLIINRHCPLGRLRSI